MPIKDEKEYLHIRLDRRAKEKLLKIIAKTRRTATQEANLAIEVYRPPEYEQQTTMEGTKQ